MQKKLEDLRSKTSLHHESGFSETLSGSYLDMANVNDNRLSLPIKNNTIGFNHNHNDDYETKPDAFGKASLVSPIRMFSPKDIGSFLSLLKNANTYSIPLDKIYSSMVIIDATYYLTFTGDIKTVLSCNLKMEVLRDVYIDYMDVDDKEKEKALLDFIKDFVGIDGIILTKTDVNGIISVIT